MLTNEEINERYGNRPGKNDYSPDCPKVYILCANCPLKSCHNICDGLTGEYNRIREHLEKNSTDPDADVPQEDKTNVGILYICDRRACEICDPNCRMTKDIRHAKNFELMGNRFVEKDDSRTTRHEIAGTMPVYCVNCGSMKLVKKHLIDGHRCDICGAPMHPKPTPSSNTV